MNLMATSRAAITHRPGMITNYAQNTSIVDGTIGATTASMDWRSSPNNNLIGNNGAGVNLVIELQEVIEVGRNDTFTITLEGAVWNFRTAGVVLNPLVSTSRVANFNEGNFDGSVPFTPAGDPAASNINSMGERLRQIVTRGTPATGTPTPAGIVDLLDIPVTFGTFYGAVAGRVNNFPTTDGTREVNQYGTDIATTAGAAPVDLWDNDGGTAGQLTAELARLGNATTVNRIYAAALKAVGDLNNLYGMRRHTAANILNTSTVTLPIPATSGLGDIPLNQLYGTQAKVLHTDIEAALLVLGEYNSAGAYILKPITTRPSHSVEGLGGLRQIVNGTVTMSLPQVLVSIPPNGWQSGIGS
jgi:hypothetical protein